MTHPLTPSSPAVASVTPPPAAPAPAPAAPHTGELGAAAQDDASRIARLAHLFRDSRAAGEVHPLEHLLRRHLNGDRA